jgi:hypothetical protein
VNGVAFAKSASARSWWGLAQRRSTKSPGGVQSGADGSEHLAGNWDVGASLVGVEIPPVAVAVAVGVEVAVAVGVEVAVAVGVAEIGRGAADPPQAVKTNSARKTGGRTLVRLHEAPLVGSARTPPCFAAMHRTKTEAALAEAEIAHADDPERAELLRRARHFKASWIELGEALTGLKRSGRWKQWGYESLDAYAKGELHLRQETVDKLTGSYSFLRRHAPTVLARDALRERIPSYQAVDFLRRAEASEQAPTAAVEEIRRRVLEEAAPAASIAREYRDVVFPIDADQRRTRELAGLKNVAKRLHELLAETRAVPRKLAGDVSGALERLLDAIGDEEQAA